MSSLNITKKYPELLELAYLSEREREHDLHAIFKRDIEDNCQFSFRGWRIYPIKTDGEIDMARLFKHLTCEEIMVENEDGTTYPKRVFEMARSQRLHWINHGTSRNSGAWIWRELLNLRYENLGSILDVPPFGS